MTTTEKWIYEDEVHRTHVASFLFGQKSIQRKLEDTCRSRGMYEGISGQMGENGYARSWQQCRCKIKYLKNAQGKGHKQHVL